MPDAPYALRQKCEASAKAYAVSRLAETTALSDTDLRTREEVTKRSFPCVIFDCSRGAEREESKGTGLAEIDLAIFIGTHAETADAAALAPAQHAARVGIISEWFNTSDATKALLLAWFNTNSPVKGLLLYDILDQQEDGEQTSGHWMDRISLRLIVQMQDE